MTASGQRLPSIATCVLCKCCVKVEWIDASCNWHKREEKVGDLKSVKGRGFGPSQKSHSAKFKNFCDDICSQNRLR